MENRICNNLSHLLWRVSCIFASLVFVCKLIETWANASSCLTAAQFHLEPICSYNSRSNRVFVTETIFHLIGLTRRVISRTAANSSAGFCLQSFCINGNNFFTDGNNKLSSFALHTECFFYDGWTVLFFKILIVR